MMMRHIHRTKRFKKDFKRILRGGHNMRVFDEVVSFLATGNPLPLKHQDHALTGNWSGHRECHLAPDWLLIYRLTADELELVRTGSHADLFQ